MNTLSSLWTFLCKHSSSWDGALVMSLGIACFGIVFYYYFRSAIKPLEIATRDTNERIRRTEGPEDFASKFEEISSWMDSHPLFGSAWKEFSLNLLPPRAGIGNQVIRNFHRASEYFSPSALLAGKINISFYQWIPNALTGLGILGTFWGLVAGLYLANDGLMTDDPTKTKAALGSLLGGASLAFLTSLFGVTSSLLMNWKQKHHFHVLEQEVETFNLLLEERLRFSSREELLHESLEQQRQQTDHLRSFNTDLAVSIAGALDDRLTARMGPALDRLLAGIETIRSDRSELGQNMITNIVGEFQKTLSGSASGELNQLAATLRNLDGALQQTASSITSGQDRINETTKMMAESVKNALNQGGESMNALLASSIQELSSQLKTAAAESANDLRGSGANVATHIQQTMQEMTTLLKQSFDQVQEGLNGIKGTSSHMADTMKSAMESGGSSIQDQLTEAVKHFSGIMQSASEQTSKNMIDAGSVVSEKMINATSGFVAGVNQLQHLTSQLQSLSNTGISVQEHLNQNVKSLQDILMLLRQAAAPLQESAKAAKDASDQTRNASVEIKNWVVDCKEISANLTQTTTNLQTAWNQSVTRFEGVDASLKEVMSELIRGVEAYSQQVKKFQADLDTHLAKALGDLGGVVNELGDQISDLDEVLRHK